MLRRSITVFLILAIVLSVSVCAFAAEIDFNDYITDESVSGDDTVIEVSIPLDELSQIQWRLWDRTNGTWPLIRDFIGPSFTYSYNSSMTYALTVNPFGTDTLDVRDIPDGTTLTFSYLATGVGYSGDSGIPARVSVTYYDSNGKSLGYVNGSFVSGQFLEDNSVSFTLNKPDGCVSIRPGLTFDGFKPIGNVTATITLKSVSFQFSVDSLLRLQQETGRTNKLLESIKDQLDDMLNREPEPVEPTWGESAGDASDKENEILDQLDPDKVTNDLADIHLTLVDNLLLYANAFSLIAAIWGVFFELPVLKIVTYCSLLFGLLAAFLGMGLAAGRASDRHSRRSSGKKGK